MAAQNGHWAMPNSAVDVSRPDRVRADREEGHEAEVEQAGQPERDVQPEAHQDVERDERDGRRHERAQAERDDQDDEQQDTTDIGMASCRFRSAGSARTRSRRVASSTWTR